MKDFEGKDSAQIEHVRQEFLRVSGLYGFEYVDPSPMENLSTLETRSGPAIRDEIYHFQDKGGRDVALRFDFTMGLARRASSQRSEKLPSKVSSFGGVFRYDEPQKGRYRYFHQWDFEIFGKPTIQVDAEIVEMTSMLFDSLKLNDNISIRISHRNLIESKIRQVCGDGGNISAILRAVDKIAKKPKQAIIDEYIAATANAASSDASTDEMRNNLEHILDFASISGDIKTVENTADDHMKNLDGWEYLTLLFDSLQSRGVCNAKVDFGIVRGLDYYSGMVFEVFYNDDKQQNNAQYDNNLSLGALAGGGRYDALMNAFGRSDLGAAGVAGGVERIILAMNQKGIFDDMAKSSKNNLIAVLYATPKTQSVAAQIASVLRKNNITTEFDIAERNLKKQLTHATQKHAHAIILVGPRELEHGNVVLRVMDTDIQHTLSLKTLLDEPFDLLMPLI